MRVETASISVADDDAFGKAIDVLRQFNYLHELRIERTQDSETLTFSDLADLNQLRFLTLDHIVLQEEDVPNLALLGQLTEIDLTPWHLQKPEVIQRLLGALPGCRLSEERIEYPDYDGSNEPSY
jgi:hypothetical protein